MRYTRSILATSLLAATLAGCLSPIDADPAARAGVEISATHSATQPPVSTVTPRPDGGFRFVSTAVLDAPEGAAWAKIGDIRKLLEIALPAATGFQWLDGGNLARVPSRYSFQALGATVVEEITRRDVQEKVFGYRVVYPALGLQSYTATITLDAADNTHTVITFSRDITFADPSAVGTWAALFEQEIADIQAYFANNPH
ncbi:SRPBCC family protein [Longimicrobium sp.]|uniref:SRPBCC family protein n=1 Tax=Longimicrobium sp. TaxID=2029185 RepID=UPI003B3AFB87